MVHASTNDETDEELESGLQSMPACRCRLPGCAICSERDLKWRPGLSREEAKRRSKVNREMTVRQNRKKAERTAQASASGVPEPVERRQERPAGEGSEDESQPSSSGKERRHRREWVAGSSTVADPAPGVDDGTADAPPLYEKLPTELWHRILSFLDPRSACRAAGCDRHLARLVSDPGLWHSLHQSVFGPVPADGAAGLLPMWQEEGERARSAARPRSNERESIVGSASSAPEIAHPGEAESILGGSAVPEIAHPACTPRRTTCDDTDPVLGLSARRRCCVSEASLGHWRRACAPGASGFPVPGLSGMLSGSFVGELGISVHTDHITRLWEANSGRRIGAFQHRGKALLTCVAGAECGSRGPAALVGDSAGQVSYFGLDDEAGFQPSACGSLGDAGCPIEQLLLLPDSISGPPRGVAVNSRGEVFMFTAGDPAGAVPVCRNAQAVASGGVSFSEGLFVTGHGSRGAPLALWLPNGVAGGGGAGDADAVRLDLNTGAVVWRAVIRDRPVQQGGAGGVGGSDFGGAGWVGGGTVASFPPFLPDVSGLSLDGDEDDEPYTGGGLPSVGPSGSHGHRSACFSPGWQLLAAVDAGRVLLWDVRAPGAAAVAVVRLPGAQRAACVNLDAGRDGWSGQMLVGAERHRAVHVFDIRRVQSAASDGQDHRKQNPIGGAQEQHHPAYLGQICTGAHPPACVAASHRRLCIGAAARTAAAVLMAPVGQSREASEVATEAAAGKAAVASASHKKKARAQKEHSRKSRPQ